MSFKRLPKKQFFFVLIFILNLNQGYGQPKNWKCTDLDGKLKFSVFADSLFALNEDIYCIRLGGETILFNKSPFQPVWREKNAVFKPGNKEKCFLKLNGTIQIFDLLTLKTLQGYLFSKVELWRNQILGKRENDWVFQPGLPTEMVADSIKASDRLLFLYSRRGLVCVDSNLNQSYYPVSGEKIEISPYLNYVKSDSNWIPVGQGKAIKAFESAFWWNRDFLADKNKDSIQFKSQSISFSKRGDSVIYINQSFALLFSAKNQFLITTSGKSIRIPSPENIVQIEDTMLAVKTSKGYLFVGISGQKTKVNSSVSALGMVHEGLISSKAGRRYGFVDRSGYIRIACRYDSTLNFEEGLAAIKLGNFWGFVDREEKIKIQPNFSSVTSFQNGYSIVSKDGKYGLIDKSGYFLLPLVYDSILKMPGKGWRIVKNSWSGFANTNAQITITPRFFNIIEASTNLLKICRDGKTGIFYKNGKPLFDLNFEDIQIDNHNFNLFIF